MDEHYMVSTPENIPIQYELAGVGSRFVAALADFLIIFGVQAGLILLVLAAGSIPALAPALRKLLLQLGPWLFSAVIIINSALFVGYPLVFELVWSGQTPGKRAVGIRVVQADGAPLAPLAAVTRNVVRLVDFLPVYYIIGVVVMLADGKSRRLGDMAAGAICIKQQRNVSIASLTLPQTPASAGALPEPGAEQESLRALSYEDYYLLKEFLTRREQMAPAAAEKLARQIADRVATHLGIERGTEPAQAFLQRIAAGLQQRPPRP